MGLPQPRAWQPAGSGGSGSCGRVARWRSPPPDCRKHGDIRLSWADLVGIAVCEQEEIHWVLGVDPHLCLGGAALIPAL